MRAGRLSPTDYLDRATAALLARNAGFTLGQATKGREIVSQLDFFPSAPETPTAGADFDAMRVSLEVIEEDLDASAFRLAEARLKRLDYVEGAYGWGQRNLELGFRPAVSGHFRNPFRHSIAAAGRSLLWALVAPGAPQLAASLAWEDATIDHSGEGACAAAFWAGLLSAAFLESGWRDLIEIGRKMVPTGSSLSRAAEVAFQCRDMNLHELDARGRILHHCGGSLQSDAPLNTGLGLIGWLYGEKDLGLTLCKTANCGFAADRNASLAGALFGIQHGRAGLDKRWTEAIGTSCPVGGGFKERVPEADVPEIASRLTVLGARLLAERDLGPRIEEAPAAATPGEEITQVDDTPTEPDAAESSAPSVAEALRATGLVAFLPERHPFEQLFEAGPLHISAGWNEPGPSIRPRGSVILLCRARNAGKKTLKATASANAPEGWEMTSPQSMSPHLDLSEGETQKLGYVVRALPGSRVHGCQHARLVFEKAVGKAVRMELPVCGSQRWRLIGPFRNVGEEGFNKAYGPEDNQDPNADFLGRDGGLVAWREETFTDLEIPIEDELFNGREGVGYGVTCVWCGEPEEVRLGLWTNDGAKVWLNGQRVLQWHSHDPFWPSLDAVTAWSDISLRAGENRFLVKFVRDEAPYRFAFTLLDRSGRPHERLGNTSL